MKLTASIILLFSFNCLAVNSQIIKDSFPNYGNEKKESSYFRERYQHNDLVHYLDNMNDFVTYESETTGNFNMPDQLIFSVSGNSFRWNKYYLDGFRLDSRFAAGSNNYQPDMFTHSLNLNYYQSTLYYTTDSIVPNSLALRYNVGELGGISPFTDKMIGLFHSTATQRMYQPIEKRANMQGAGNIFLNYSVPGNGNKYLQQLYADFGTRMLVDFDYAGISDYYPEKFSKVQLSGQLPIQSNNLFDKLNYLSNFQQRENMNNELYYSKAETAQNSSYNFSVYGSKIKEKLRYTSGLTVAANIVRHNNLNLSRNLIDQDGEAFEPWYPDGNTTEFSHALNFSKSLFERTQLTFDSYNSLINFKPSTNSFHNPIYAQNTLTSTQPTYQSLYLYQWQSNSFTGGLLENTLGIKTKKELSKNITFRANIDLTLDAMLLKDKSMIRPNWQGQMGFDIHPARWFSMELNFSRNRVSYNLEDARYLSNDYLNADIYYWNDLNNDKEFQEKEKSDFFTSSGGKYHTTAANLKQQNYFVVDFPMYFRFGKHSEFSLLTMYRKYNNNWTTRFEKAASDYGYYQNEGAASIYLLNSGTPINYVLDYYPESYMNSNTFYNFLTNSPFYFSNTIKYQYSNEKFLFSFSWISYLMGGISTLGNGPLHNNLGVYSESSANPNILHKLVGRLDQERAYVAHLMMSYKLNKHLNFSFTGKFKDGQAFTNFDTKLATDKNGNTQMAIWSHRTKGINPLTGEFGSRKDAFFNVDISTTYTGKISKYDYQIQALLYNIYDFGTELTEYTFEPIGSDNRFAMSLNIPRGLMLTAKIYF